MHLLSNNYSGEVNFYKNQCCCKQTNENLSNYNEISPISQLDFSPKKIFEKDTKIGEREKHRSSKLYNNCILRNNCSPPIPMDKLPDNVHVTHDSPSSCESPQNLKNPNPILDYHKLIPRNHIKTYKVFRNSTFKFISNEKSSLQSSSNQINKGNTHNCTNSTGIYINKVNRTIMMKKITEIATEKASFGEFKRVIPHPIIDDARFNQFLEDALTGENNYCSSSKHISSGTSEIDPFSQNIDPLKDKSQNTDLLLEDIDEYEKILVSKLDEIRQLKINPKKERKEGKLELPNSIFVYHSKNGLPEYLKNNRIKRRTQSNQNVSSEGRTNEEISESFQKIKLETKINDFETKNIKICQPDYTKKCFIASEDIQEKEIYPKNEGFFNGSNLEMNNKSNSSENNNKNDNNLQSEFEVYVEDQMLNGKENLSENLMHIPLFFKCANGKKIRFKIKYLGKMGQAFRAFSSRMNITFLSEIKFATIDGCTVTTTDTPQSLGLKPYDIIMVTNN